MLGVLHRAALRQGPPQFWDFFFPEASLRSHSTRASGRRHPWPLKETRQGRFLELVRRSALGLVAVYNLLPGDVVSAKTVKDFQTSLQDLVKARAAAGCEDWKQTLSPRTPLWRHPLK